MTAGQKQVQQVDQLLGLGRRESSFEIAPMQDDSWLGPLTRYADRSDVLVLALQRDGVLLPMKWQENSRPRSIFLW